MGTCFVIQPFDGAVFDKRYRDIFAPAIEDASLEPYRVDQDPGTAIPIQDIEAGIRSAEICFAEITTDNPNVWYELGFSFAIGRPVVMVCSGDRKGNFPFDVQHRSIIRYEAGSTSDFDNLRQNITESLSRQIRRQSAMENLPTELPLSPTDGLSQKELAALVSAAEYMDTLDEGVAPDQIRRRMANAGFTPIASTLALDRLQKRGFLLVQKELGEYNEPVTWLQVSNDAMQWLHRNEERLNLKEAAKPAPPIDLSDDIPF